jgi:hypothetical protein
MWKCVFARDFSLATRSAQIVSRGLQNRSLRSIQWLKYALIYSQKVAVGIT